MLPKQKEVLFDERAADKEVINSLLREISRLKGENSMAKIIQSTDGKLYLVHNFEEIDESRANELLTDLQADVQVLQNAVTSAPASDGSSDTTPATPSEDGQPAADDGNTTTPTDGSADGIPAAGDATTDGSAPADGSQSAPTDSAPAADGTPATTDPAPAGVPAPTTDAPAAPLQ